MKSIITNKHNLPETLVRAIEHDTHPVGGDISVSQIIDAPQIKILKRKHTISEDVVDRIWMLLGTAVHHILERANVASYQKRAFLTVIDTFREDYNKTQDPKIEGVIKWTLDYVKKTFPEVNERFMLEFTLSVNILDKTLYGTIDMYDKIDHILEDYKLCSVYNYIIPDSYKKWMAQQNTYAYMLRENGYEVKKSFITAIFKDWSRQKAAFEKDYPKIPVMQFEIPLQPTHVMSKYLVTRMKLHTQAELGNVPDCTPKERWAKADSWAIKLEGRKTALKANFISESQAQKWMAENAHKYPKAFIEYRPGTARRCDEFCAVRDVCPQRKRTVEKEEKK